jgi:hypothetical protein
MAELMAGCTNALKGGGVGKFVGNGIGVDVNIIEPLGAAPASVILTGRETPLMRPDVAFGSVLRYACIDDVNLVDIPVAIPIIVGIVDLRVSEFEGFNHHLRSSIVKLVVGSRTVILASLRECEGTNHVEVDGEQAVALLNEVVSDGTNMAVQGVTLLVEAIVPLLCGTGLQAASCVGELDEQYQSALCLGLCLGLPWTLAVSESDIGLAHFLKASKPALVHPWQSVGMVRAARITLSGWQGTGSDAAKKCCDDGQKILSHTIIYYNRYYG